MWVPSLFSRPCCVKALGALAAALGAAASSAAATSPPSLPPGSSVRLLRANMCCAHSSCLCLSSWCSRGTSPDPGWRLAAAACASCATSPLSAATSCAVAVCAASSASSLTPSADRVTALLAWSLPAGVELPAAAVAAAAGATAARAAPCSATVADSWSSRSPRLVVAPATWPDSALTAASSACCLALLLAWRDDSWPAMAATAALVADTASS
mmetsp:Transcript_14592/g.36305  ORF Transcript_14592/g.36305 Transcript_14592/m.36305 type:complete len:213 (+) Transcript_14592:1472-2110(+)